MTASRDLPPDARNPQAELRGFEPLRVTLALGALLLGLFSALHG